VGAAAVGAGLIGAALADFAAVIEGDLPGAGGGVADRGALAFAQVPAHRVDELVAGPGGQRIQAGDQPWLAPAPSQVTISRRRKAGGSAVIAASKISRWPATVLLPALPGRSTRASGSPVLSQ
jgi:hypothetical protein